jgi:hypothetical protein
MEPTRMIQMKQNRAISSVQMYLGIKPVYLESICIETGSNSRNIKAVSRPRRNL